MSDTDRQLFGQAVAEALAEKYDEELSRCEETVQCSREHYRSMSGILRFKINEKTGTMRKSRKGWIALLLAAALLLAGCAVLYRREIYDFVVDIFDRYIRVTYTDEAQEGSPVTIETPYALSYVPEGYTLVGEETRRGFVSQDFENDARYYISFQQQTIGGTLNFLGGEQGETTVLEYGSLHILCREKDSFGVYLWSDGSYSLCLMSNKPLYQSELCKIIDGIVMRGD